MKPILSFLLERVPDQIRSRSREVSGAAGSSGSPSGRNDLYLSNAPRDTSSRVGLLSDLRDGPRALLVTADSGPNHELADMRRRFWIGLVLTLPVFFLDMGGHLTGLADAIGQQTSNWIQLAFATPVVSWAGWPFF
jgi:hypothetical protein